MNTPGAGFGRVLPSTNEAVQRQNFLVAGSASTFVLSFKHRVKEKYPNLLGICLKLRIKPKDT